MSVGNFEAFRFSKIIYLISNFSYVSYIAVANLVQLGIFSGCPVILQTVTKITEKTTIWTML